MDTYKPGRGSGHRSRGLGCRGALTRPRLCSSTLSHKQRGRGGTHQGRGVDRLGPVRGPAPPIPNPSPANCAGEGSSPARFGRLGARAGEAPSGTRQRPKSGLSAFAAAGLPAPGQPRPRAAGRPSPGRSAFQVSLSPAQRGTGAGGGGSYGMRGSQSNPARSPSPLPPAQPTTSVIECAISTCGLAKPFAAAEFINPKKSPRH